LQIKLFFVRFSLRKVRAPKRSNLLGNAQCAWAWG